MWMFVLGLGTGVIVGIITVAIVAAKDPTENYEKLDRIRNKATRLEREAKELPDFQKQCQAEGMWMAIEEWYRD